MAAALLVLASGCADSPEPGNAGSRTIQPREFLEVYNQIDRQLATVANEAAWESATDVNDETTGTRIGAERALGAFRGSAYVIQTSRRLLDLKASLSDEEFRQLDKILLLAAETPATIPEVVRARVETEAHAAALLHGFEFCLEKRAANCAQPVTANQIDQTLAHSADLPLRRRYWETSKQTGPPLKPHLVRLRDLRNRVAHELGYDSYFHLQVADYGMSVEEMLKLTGETVEALRPLYEQLHLYTRRRLAARYRQPAPEKLPAHWLGSRWGQAWPGIVESVELDSLFARRQPEWIVRQAEEFYVSLGLPPLPDSFWSKSDLYELPPGSKRRKDEHASAWHIDGERDVRAIMSLTRSFRWFETAHRELGRIHYFLAYSTPEVPPVLRDGANRAFHEAIGGLIGMAARQEPYLRSIGLAGGNQGGSMQWLLNEALDSSVVFVPFAAGVLTRFEHDLYHERLPEGQFNRRWWDLVDRYQGMEPPAPRGEQFCDACTETHLTDDPAQSYDQVLALLIKHQLHDYIARRILEQDPRSCNYFGNKQVGEWLNGIMSLGATRDWRDVLREKTGEDISPRAMLEYYRPLMDHLKEQNAIQ